MRDLIRSPLQFVRPMTEQEWAALKLRATNRELRRDRRRRAKQQSAPVKTVASRRIELIRRAQAADSSGVF
jgi:hypothetical protein